MLEIAKIMCGGVKMLKTFVYRGDPAFLTAFFFPPVSRYPLMNSVAISSAESAGEIGDA
jgi:hypothetical protein